MQPRLWQRRQSQQTSCCRRRASPKPRGRGAQADPTSSHSLEQAPATRRLRRQHQAHRPRQLRVRTQRPPSKGKPLQALSGVMRRQQSKLVSQESHLAWCPSRLEERQRLPIHQGIPASSHGCSCRPCCPANTANRAASGRSSRCCSQGSHATGNHGNCPAACWRLAGQCSQGGTSSCTAARCSEAAASSAAAGCSQAATDTAPGANQDSADGAGASTAHST